MTDNSTNNKRIAKNTLMLYLRMILILIVTLYTSRVVLQTLGVSDFGVYNVVGGFVSMLAYLNSVFVGSTQRFLSFAIGKNDDDTIETTMATVKVIHLCLAAIVFVVAETFGIWFVNNQLVIDPTRLLAANCVFQFSLISLIITIRTIPYNSCVVAHEHMQIYARVGILEVFLKLAILYLLIVLPGAKLIIYGLLHVAISISVMMCYTLYCKKHFKESRARLNVDKKLFKEMFSYAGWTTIGSLGFSFKDQFSNMILNGFFGTTINAARGLAMVVNSAITSFASNFFMAISPQIIKQYASGNVEQSKQLVYSGAKYSFFLLSLITIPIYFNIEYLLDMWLDIVPEYTSVFIQITLISSLVYSLTSSVTTAIQATGRIKGFQIGVVLMAELPIAYVILKMGHPAPYALLPSVITNIIALIFRFYLLKKYCPYYSNKDYYLSNILRCVLVFAMCLIPCWFISSIFGDTFILFCSKILASFFVIALIISLFGLTKLERNIVIKFIKSKLHK